MNFVHLPKMKPVPFGQPYPLFTRISLETTRTCTRSCWFCPSKERGKAPITMSERLYQKILDELDKLKFDGVVQWFYLNEPLIDRDYLARIRMLRVACPDCTIHVTTNWDVYAKKTLEFQVDKIEELLAAGVNSLNLNDYDNRGYRETVVHASLTLNIPMVDHCWKRLGPRKQVISCGPLPEEGKIHSWTGYISAEDLRTHGATSQGAASHCPRPMRHIVVMYDGRVPLCCAVDPTRPNVEIFGDINRQTLREVWDSYKMFQYRERLQRGERSGQCTGCDARVAYAHVVRKVKL